MNRRDFLKGSTVLGGALAFGPLQALSARVARGAPVASVGYGPLVNKGDLWLPAEFNYQIISRQGEPLRDGRPTPGIFDGMGAFRGRRNTTILIRNHENREQVGEQRVIVPPTLEYDPLTAGGNTKLEVRRSSAGRDPVTGQDLYRYEVVSAFAILGGTSTNCAGGIRHGDTWITCEEVVKRSANGVKHGYIFEIDASADGPVAAIPVRQAGRRAHEAAFELASIVYLTEDRSIVDDVRTLNRKLGACFYRYIPDIPGGRLGQSGGTLQALKLRDEFHANMDFGRVAGTPCPVEWVTVDEPDHDDDTDDRRDRVSGFTPNRVQAQDKGAAFFDRLEGMWISQGELGNGGKVYFDATAGGPQNLGQVWEYDPQRETLALIYEGTDAARLQAPDNVVIVPQTGDIFLQEDGSGEQYVRGVTIDGQIYDFAKTAANESEFCGGCFDPDGHTLYLNQQGDRGDLPHGPLDNAAVTYAIYGPFTTRGR
jgi:secreted PhoX family phosphatase